MDSQQSKHYLAEEAYAGAGKLNTRLHIQEHYSTGRVPWFRWVRDQMRLATGMRILDVGTGPAHVWWRNSERLPPDLHLFLGDLSRGMVTAARANLAGAGLAAAFLCLDCEQIPCGAARFDGVLALGLLDHLPHRERGLAEIWRVLRPGGRFYASGGGRTHLQEIEALVSPFLPDVAYGGAPDRFGLENGVALLSTFFERVERHEFADTLRFHDPDPLLAYVFSEEEVARKLTGAQRSEFEAAVAGRLAAEGEICVTRRKGLFVAVREGAQEAAPKAA